MFPDLEPEWIMILTVTTSFLVGWQVLRVHRTRLRRQQLRERSAIVASASSVDVQSLEPREVREASHRVANQATIVQAYLRKLSQMPDPFAELVRSVRKARWNNAHRN
jgi:hypothetical protein